MTVLTRKITRAKWEASEALGKGEIPADAMSADLRTTGNTLSFWNCATGEDHEIRKAVLALASVAERADRMDVAWIEKAAVDEHGIATMRTPGRTPVDCLQETHVDLIRLDVRRLGRVAELVSEAIDNGN